MSRIFKAQVDYRDCAGVLRSEVPRMLPYAVASTLTALSGDLRTRLQNRMPEVFDRPKEFTIRGVYTFSASRSKPQAGVYFPRSADEQGKATREYLRPGAEGAQRRNQKKTEYLLTRMGYLPAGWVTTPGRSASLDANGNIPGAVYRQIINVLQIRYNSLKPISQRSQKAAKRLGVTALFFAVAPGVNSLAKGGGWLPPGVWQHKAGKKIVQILKFVKKASYKPRLNLEQEAKATLSANLPIRWAESFSAVQARFALKGRR